MITQERHITRKDKKFLKIASSKAVVGSECRPNNPLVLQFGCNNCAWRDTPMCPHKLSGMERHANHICSQRVNYVHDILQTANSGVRLLQVEHTAQLKLLIDKMLHDYHEGDFIDKTFVGLSKNLISIMDKMRRQDEGLKIQGDISLAVQDFRNIVDAQAEIVKDKDIVKEAEFVENANKSNNGTGNGLSEQEVQSDGYTSGK